MIKNVIALKIKIKYTHLNDDERRFLNLRKFKCKSYEKKVDKNAKKNFFKSLIADCKCFPSKWHKKQNQNAAAIFSQITHKKQYRNIRNVDTWSVVNYFVFYNSKFNSRIWGWLKLWWWTIKGFSKEASINFFELFIKFQNILTRKILRDNLKVFEDRLR